MANLIITVISIALVAVAAIMGAYFGGSAFMDGQTSSTANRMLSEEQQIATALTLYLIDNNNNIEGLKVGLNYTASNLYPKYINTQIEESISHYTGTGLDAFRVSVDAGIKYISFMGNSSNISRKACYYIFSKNRPNDPNASTEWDAGVVGYSFATPHTYDCRQVQFAGTFYFQYKL